MGNDHEVGRTSLRRFSLSVQSRPSMKFELSRLATNCSNEEIIVEIQRVDSLINKNWLSRRDFDRVAKVNSVTVIKRFGSFEQALTIAGLEHKHTDQPEIRSL